MPCRPKLFVTLATSLPLCAVFGGSRMTPWHGKKVDWVRVWNQTRLPTDYFIAGDEAYNFVRGVITPWTMSVLFEIMRILYGEIHLIAFLPAGACTSKRVSGCLSISSVNFGLL